MTLLDALAAAVRDRLLAGAPAPLPGLGTLGRAHVSARVHTGADGGRVLLPPGVAIGLSPAAADPTGLASALVRLSGAPPEASAGALRDAVDQLEARLAITGEARLDGVGVFQRTSSGIRFAAAPDLLAAVNRPFEGLAPVPVRAPPTAPVAAAAPAVATEPSAMPEPPVRPASLPPVEPGAVDILLDLIVNEPAETTEPPDAATPDAAMPDAAMPDAATPDAAMPDAGSPATSAFVDEDDGAVAVPFGLAAGEPDLQSVLPDQARGRLPPDRDPSTAPRADGWSAPDLAPPPAAPLDPFGGDAEDADVVSDRRAAPDASTRDTSTRDASTRDAATPAEADAHPAGEPALDTVPADTTADGPPLVDVALAADGAAGVTGAEPLFAAATPEPPVAMPPAATPAAVQDAATPAAPSALAERPARRAWAFLYLAAVLALSALVVWWAVQERRADPGPATVLRSQ